MTSSQENRILPQGELQMYHLLMLHWKPWDGGKRFDFNHHCRHAVRKPVLTLNPNPNPTIFSTGWRYLRAWRREHLHEFITESGSVAND